MFEFLSDDYVEPTKKVKKVKKDPAIDIKKAINKHFRATPIVDDYLYDWIHPSSIGREPVSELVFRYWRGREPETFDISKELMFDTGHFYHSYIQKILYEMGILAGQEGFVQTTKPYTFPTFKEERIRNKQYRLSCRTDGIISLDRLWWYQKPVGDMPEPTNLILWDLKSTNTFSYKNCNESDDLDVNYKLQAECYFLVSDLNSLVFSFLNKDSHIFKNIRYNSESEHYNKVKEKCLEVLGHIVNETIPTNMDMTKTQFKKFISDYYKTNGEGRKMVEKNGEFWQVKELNKETKNA